MNFVPSLLTTIAALAAPLSAQLHALAPSDVTWDYEVRVAKGGVEHRLQGSQEIFLGAVMLSLSPKLAPYAPGLPPSLADFVTIGACFGKAGQTFVFASPLDLIPFDVPIYSQAALLNANGLQVSAVHRYQRSRDGLLVDTDPTDDVARPTRIDDTVEPQPTNDTVGG